MEPKYRILLSNYLAGQSVRLIFALSFENDCKIIATLLHFVIPIPMNITRDSVGIELGGAKRRIIHSYSVLDKLSCRGSISVCL